jgi:hypothetical protein
MVTLSYGVHQLFPIHNAYFVHEQKATQPGEPVFSTFEFNNPADSQPFCFIITMPAKKEANADISFDDITISINQQDALIIPVSLKQKEILYCDGHSVKLYSNQWQLKQTIELNKIDAACQ